MSSFKVFLLGYYGGFLHKNDKTMPRHGHKWITKMMDENSAFDRNRFGGPCLIYETIILYHAQAPVAGPEITRPCPQNFENHSSSSCPRPQSLKFTSSSSRPEDELWRGLWQSDCPRTTRPVLRTPDHGDSDVDMVMLVTESFC